jgi:hypothetical protein
VKIAAVRASWLQARIPPERAHVSDFGRNDSFNTCLVEIETDPGSPASGKRRSASATSATTRAWWS